MFGRLAEASLTEEIGRIESWGSDVTWYKMFEQEALDVLSDLSETSQGFAKTAWFLMARSKESFSQWMVWRFVLIFRISLLRPYAPYGRSCSIVPQNHWQCWL